MHVKMNDGKTVVNMNFVVRVYISEPKEPNRPLYEVHFVLDGQPQRFSVVRSEYILEADAERALAGLLEAIADGCTTYTMNTR